MGRVFGPEAIKAQNSSGVTTIPVASTGTVYTKSIKISYGAYFAVSLLLSSANGTVDQIITVEQSFQPPATEGAADDNWVTPNGMSAIVTNRTAETMYHASLSPITMKYIRFVIAGKNSNNADATAQVWLHMQEEA